MLIKFILHIKHLTARLLLKLNNEIGLRIVQGNKANSRESLFLKKSPLELIDYTIVFV